MLHHVHALSRAESGACDLFLLFNAASISVHPSLSMTRTTDKVLYTYLLSSIHQPGDNDVG